MRTRNKIVICQILASIFALIYLFEYLTYYIILLQCSWPELTENYPNASVTLDVKEKKLPVKALFLSDIHVLGLNSARPFDRLIRERQMFKSFHAAVYLFEPEIIFVLGDLFDDASKCTDREFRYFVRRLQAIFQVNENITIYFLPGNQDLGYHYDMTQSIYKRFAEASNLPPVKLVSIRGNHFVLLNSMAMEGDECFLCEEAEIQLNQIAKKFRCAKGIGKCPASESLDQFSRPILLQHFLMYRESDKICLEMDDAPEEEKTLYLLQGWDCLSQEASEMIFDLLNPRLIVGGHIHQDCHVVHRNDIHEYTVASFNWRYRDRPSFLMGVFLPSNYSISKCYLPRETVVMGIYLTGFGLILICIILLICPGTIPYEFPWIRIRW